MQAFRSDGFESEFLVLGSILIVACFFAGPNGGYRAIFLLFLLPGLREIAAGVSPTRFGGVLSLTPIAILLLLWQDIFRHAIVVLFRPTGSEHGLSELPYLLFFALRELGWWFVVAVGSAVAALFFSRSQTLRWMLVLPRHAPNVAP